MDGVVTAYSRPGPHDPLRCKCPACFRWRCETTDAGDLLIRWAETPSEPDPVLTPARASETDPEPEETPVALFAKKPEPDPNLSTCDLCGVATEAPPPPTLQTVASPWNPGSMWARCATCTAIVAEAGGSERARAALLLEVLDVDGSANDPAVIETARGLPLARDDIDRLAVAVLSSGVGSQEPTRPAGAGSDVRWSHVTPEVRQHLAERLADLRRKARPHRCTDGVCGGCGVRKSMHWYGPHQMAATSTGRAPQWALCEDCEAIRVKAGGSCLTSDWTCWLSAAAFDLPTASLGFAAVRGYALVAGAGPLEAPGFDQRFGYLSAEDREAIWRIWPKTAPPEVQQRRRRAEAAAALVNAGRPREPVRAIDLDV